MRISTVLRHSVGVAAFFLILSTYAIAQSTPMEAVKMFEAAFNAGDNAKAQSLMSPSGLVIVDEFPPHLWNGTAAFATWMADYTKDAATKGLTDPAVTIGTPLVNTVTGSVAYLVCPATYTYKLKGVPMREPARMAMVLHKEGQTWRFVSWTWTGTVPKAVAR